MAYHSQNTSKALIVNPKYNRKEPELVFTSDRKGDDQNLHYGSLDKYKTPRYRNAGYGRLIGLDRRFRILPTSGTNKELIDGGDDSTRKDRSTPSLTTTSIPQEAEVQLTRTAIEDYGFIDQEDFMPFNSNKRNKRRKLSTFTKEDEYDSRFSPDLDSTVSSDSSSSELEHGNNKHHIPESSDAYEQFRNHPDNKTQMDLTNRTNICPTDAEAWIALIQHQEAYFLLSTSSDRKIARNSERRAISEIKLNLYERALEKVVDQTAKEELLEGYLTEGAKLWDTKKQLDKWRSVLRENRSWTIRYRYLNFQQSNAVVFSYDACLETYEDLFRSLQRLGPADHDMQGSYLVLRLTTFMYQAGFSERALALWQALLELNSARSQNNSYIDTLEAFEQFWDAETARLGEEKAKGWQNGPGFEIQPQSDTVVPRFDKHNVFRDWSNEELTRSKDDIMPARTLDETVEDDPFRVIIFSDVKAFLLKMRTTEGMSILLQAFLKFCNLPAISSDAQERQWWSETFTSHYGYVSNENEPVNGNSSFASSMNHVVLDRGTLFTHSNWYKAWNSKVVKDSKFSRFALNALTQLTELRPDDDILAEYVLAMKFHYDASLARKFAKKLLKNRSDSLILYNAYALIEARSGRFKAGQNVWLTALSMVPSLDVKSQGQSIQLWSAMVWELLILKDLQEAPRLVTETVPQGKVNPGEPVNSSTPLQYTATQKLQAETFYRNKIDDSIAAIDPRAVQAYTEILAIFKYLINDNSLDEACAAFDTTVTALEASRLSKTAEPILQSQARLLHLHATTSPSGYRPSQIVKYLKASLSRFPENTIFNDLHQQYSRRAGIIDRLRNLPEPLDKTTQSSSSIIPTLHKLTNQLNQPIYTGTTEHSIRATFTQATTSSEVPTYHNPQIWLDYLHWELSLISTSSSSSPSIPAKSSKRLKEIYLNSLRACPWCKDLYMQGFKTEVMRGVVGDRTLREVYRGVVERGIRVRVDILDDLDEEG